MFHPEFPAEAKAAARDPVIRDTAREELVALIASELLFLTAILIVARL